MKITIISQLGETSDLACKLQEEGNDVSLYILTKGEDNVGAGLVPVYSTAPKLDADLIINDDIFFGQISDKLRRAGKKVLGGSEVTDRLENDRAFGASVMQACGIKIPVSHTFTSFTDAILFVLKDKRRFVFKPHGQEERFFTYVAKGTEDMVAMLEYYRTVWPEGLTFELQEFVDGVEMAIGGWFNGIHFCKQVLPNFEFKKLMHGDIGPNTGEMGTVMAYRTHCKLYHRTLAKAEAFLKTTGYRGFIDINCIVNDKDAYGLEWTTRFGYPTIQIQDELHVSGTWTEFLYALASGTAQAVPVDTSKWAVGVAVCALPWPQKSTEPKFNNMPVFFPADMTHIHTRDVWYDDGQYRQAGLMGYICVCTGSDVTIEKAKKKAYDVVKQVYVPGGFYRTDIGDRIINNWSLLKSWGWVR